MMVDGEEAGEIRDSCELRLDITAGHHEIQLLIDWCRSQAVQFEVEPGATVIFDCGAMRPPWQALYAITLGRNRYIALGPSDESSASVGPPAHHRTAETHGLPASRQYLQSEQSGRGRTHNRLPRMEAEVFAA